MRQAYELDTTPYDESGAMVGYNQYMVYANIEGQALIGQIRRHCGHEPVGSHLQVVFNNHDFGGYAQIRYRYDPDNQEHLDYMFQIDSGEKYGGKWDRQAKRELKKLGYFDWLMTENIKWQERY